MGRFREIARDDEGATRLVELRITGGAHEAQTHRVGDAAEYVRIHADDTT